MHDLKNYWLTRVALKKEIVRVAKQSFVPPIYKQLSAPSKKTKP